MKISKIEYAVFVYHKKSKYNKSSKFEEVMVQNHKKMTDLKWNASTNTYILSEINIGIIFYYKIIPC
jgi:hypothetical protein